MGAHHSSRTKSGITAYFQYLLPKQNANTVRASVVDNRNTGFAFRSVFLRFSVDLYEDDAVIYPGGIFNDDFVMGNYLLLATMVIDDIGSTMRDRMAA